MRTHERLDAVIQQIEQARALLCPLASDNPIVASTVYLLAAMLDDITDTLDGLWSDAFDPDGEPGEDETTMTLPPMPDRKLRARAYALAALELDRAIARGWPASTTDDPDQRRRLTQETRWLIARLLRSARRHARAASERP